MSRDRLHIDRLRDVYGPIIVQVLRHDQFVRESHLLDKHGISRTYAVTFFPKKGHPPPVQTINQEIRMGTPIGNAFSARGYHIRRNVLDVFILQIPPWLSLAFNTSEKYAKSRLSELYVRKPGEAPQLYGAAFEVYCPDFKKPVITHQDIHTMHPSIESLEHLGVTQELIWKHLLQKPPSEFQETYALAKKQTLDLIIELKKRLVTHLEKQ